MSEELPIGALVQKFVTLKAEAKAREETLSAIQKAIVNRLDELDSQSYCGVLSTGESVTATVVRSSSTSFDWAGMATQYPEEFMQACTMQPDNGKLKMMMHEDPELADKLSGLVSDIPRSPYVKTMVHGAVAKTRYTAAPAADINASTNLVTATQSAISAVQKMSSAFSGKAAQEVEKTLAGTFAVSPNPKAPEPEQRPIRKRPKSPAGKKLEELQEGKA